MPAQMSHIGTHDSGSITAGREDRTPSQTPSEVAPDTTAPTTDTGALVDNELPIEQVEAGHEELDSGESPISSLTPATSGWKASSSFATHDSTPASLLGSSQYHSGAANACGSGIVSEFTSPSSSAPSPGPPDQMARESSEASESSLARGVTRSHGLKRPLEASDDSDEDDEPSTKHKRARASAAYNTEDDFIPSGSTLFPIPRDLAAPRSVEPTESALPGDVARSRGLKMSGEANNSTDDDEEPPAKHRSARVSRASTSQDDVETPFEHTSKTQKRSHMAMAGEDEHKDEDEPLSRKIPRTTIYIDLTDSDSDDEAAPRDIVDLTGSERESSPAPSQKPQKSYLHRLPGELRNRIYRHIGLIGARLELRSFEEPALAVAIPDLKDELYSFMLSANKLRVPVYTGFRTGLKPGADGSKKKSPKKSPKKDALGDFNNSHTAPGQVGIAPDAWVMQVDPNYVTIKHICLRILESHVSEIGHKLICDYFLNVSCKDGNMRATGRTTMETSDVLKRTFNHMSCLATERAKQFAQQDGFEGFNWEQVRHIAASFVSAADARSRYTKKSARVTLLEGLN
ncbi:hypothetical protein MBLNU13_g05748t1 [Cladosporium sp. NU13]